MQKNPSQASGREKWDDGLPLHAGTRHHMAAGPASAKILAVEEAGISLGDGVAAIIVYFGRLLMERRVAARAEPLEAVDLAGAAPALDHQEIRVRSEPGRVRGAGGGVDGRAFRHHRDLFLALRRTI